jgi:hypothetical protein
MKEASKQVPLILHIAGGRFRKVKIKEGGIFLILYN